MNRGLLTPRRVGTAVVGLLLLVGLALPLSSALRGDPAAGSGSTTPTPAPALRGESLTGQPTDLADFRGDVVLVNVWASWCAPCRDELPLLLETAEKHRADGLVLLGINTKDRRESAQDLLEEVGGLGVMRNVYDPRGRHAVAWGAHGVPETFVVDRRGRVVARHQGEVSADWIESTVVPLLEP